MKYRVLLRLFLAAIAVPIIFFRTDAASWSVRMKAELVAQIALAKKPIFDTPGTISFILPRIHDYFQNCPKQRKQEDADNFAKLIFSYVLSDSIVGYSKVRLFYINSSDTVLIEYPCNEHTIASLGIVDALPEDREDILGFALPYPNLTVRNPSQKYKHRIMGYSLPPTLPDGEPMYTIQMERYAIGIAAAVYDFVLQRNNDIVSKVIIKYSNDYKDLNSPAVSEHIYVMDKWMFKLIKENNLYPFADE